MPDPPHELLRKRFHQQLDDIDVRIRRLFALVAETIAMATDALLTGDLAAAERIKAADEQLDLTALEIEDIAQRVLVMEAPVAGEMRYLLSVMRIAPELERSGDLAEHIASRARDLARALTPELRGLIEEMGSTCVELWRAAADAWADRDGHAADEVEAGDDRLDSLHERLIATLLKADIPLPAALQVSLVARFYERLGDHAVHITEHVRYLAFGH